MQKYYTVFHEWGNCFVNELYILVEGQPGKFNLIKTKILI